MDVYIKVEDCGDDFSSPVTSTVGLDDLGSGFDPGSSNDFPMTLFDDKKTFFDPMAPMAEPVTTFHLKKDYHPGYEPVVTNIRPAAVVTSAADDVSGYVVTSAADDVSRYVVTSVNSQQQFSPTSNTQSYPGMTILYEQKSVESSTNVSRNKYLPQKQYSPTKSSDPNFTAADSNSGSTGKSFVPCKVCGDKASGYHYGVTSCEGCKGFFRRSIQKKIEYRCLRDEKCLVIRLNRNRCQFCRFKKCLDVGMSRDSVRYGRVPKRSRERLEEQQRVVSSGQQQQIETEELESTRDVALYNLTLIMAQAHHTHCPYTELKTRGLQRKPAIFSLNEFQTGSSDTTPDSLEQQKIVMWQHFATALTPLIQAVVDFAKKIPGFIELTQDDQLLLIKNGFFEMWVVYSSRLSCPPSDSTITFYDGSYITRQQVELMFDYEFVVGIFNFVASLNSMELNDTETALLVAIVLITSERQGLYDHKTIDKLQERLMEALKVQVAKNRPAEPNAFPLLMMKMPELRSLGAKHAEHLHWFRANWLRLRLPPLFAEIFDINKLDDAMPAGQQQ